MICNSCKAEVKCEKHPNGKLEGYDAKELDNTYWIVCRECKVELESKEDDPSGAIIHFCIKYYVDIAGTAQKALEK